MSGEKRKGRIYFWERIAFRISIGFLFPILLSAYALYAVSSIFTELTETKEQFQSIWYQAHTKENSAILNLTKIRLNALSSLSDANMQGIEQLNSELESFRKNLEQSKKAVDKVAVDNGIALDHQFLKLYGIVIEQHKQMLELAKRMRDSLQKNNMQEAAVSRKEIEQIATEIEGELGKLKAFNELVEMKVFEKVKDIEFSSNRTLWFYFIVVLLFGISAAIFVTLSITSPVKQVLRRMQEIAVGDGDLTKRISTRSGGEMRELAAWVNLFLEKTQSIISTITNASHVVQQTTESVGVHTKKTSVSSYGIHKNIMEQSMNMDECTNSLSGIDDLIQGSAESTRQAASLSRIAMDRALQGGASVHETIEAMEKIEESSKKIEELISSITEIASQTNLLAINAAIEATKAGEHGKGFAVVAEEVRKLAERARKLTAEVTSLTTESGSRVKAGVGLAKVAGQSLDGIIKDVDAVSSLIQRIAAASAKQTERSALILQFMQRTSDSVRENLSEIQEVTKSSDQTAFEVERLEVLVGQLNAIVDQFHVDSMARYEHPVHFSEEVTKLNDLSEEITKKDIPITQESVISEVPKGLSPIPSSAQSQEQVGDAENLQEYSEDEDKNGNGQDVA